MKFSAVFLTTIAGSAVANPVAVPNADDKAKRALPLGVVAPPAGVAGILNGVGSGSSNNAVPGLPFAIPGVGTLGGADLTTLTGPITETLAISVGSSGAQLFKVLGGLPGVGGATLPTLPAVPTSVVLPDLGAPNTVDKLSPEQVLALIQFFAAQLKNATSIDSRIPKVPLTGIPLLNLGQVQTFTPRMQFIVATLQTILATLRNANAESLPINTDAVSALNATASPIAILTSLVNSLVGLLTGGLPGLGGLGGRK